MNEPGRATITANALQGRLAVEIPPVFLNSTRTLWWNDTVEFPGFTFDSEDFNVRIGIPAIDFNGIGLAKANKSER